MGRAVVETTDNIFKVYSEVSQHSIEEKIFEIQATKSIFLIDNSKNTGNINQYIEILKDVRRNMIEGEKEATHHLQAEKERLKISDTTLEILKEAVSTHEEVYDLGSKSYNPVKTVQKLTGLVEGLRADEMLSKGKLSKGKLSKRVYRGGNKKYFTGKIKKRVSKKESQKRKSKKKIKNFF